MNKFIPWILAGLFLFLALYFYMQKHEAESRLAIADNMIEEVDAELEQRGETVDSLEDMMLAPDTMELVPPGGAAFVDELGSLSERDLQRLQQKGLRNPETDLMNNMLNMPPDTRGVDCILLTWITDQFLSKTYAWI